MLSEMCQVLKLHRERHNYSICRRKIFSNVVSCLWKCGVPVGREKGFEVPVRMFESSKIMMLFQQQQKQQRQQRQQQQQQQGWRCQETEEETAQGLGECWCNPKYFDPFGFRCHGLRSLPATVMTCPSLELKNMFTQNGTLLGTN